MPSWIARSGLLAVLILPACDTYDRGHGARPIYAAYPGYAYGSPYGYPAPGYYYAPPPRSYFTFGFSTSHHRHGRPHRQRYHRHHW